MNEKNIKVKKTVSEKIRDIVGVVLLVVLIPILVCNLTLMIKGIISDDVPTFLGYGPLFVGENAGSMEGGPEDIKRGDLVVVKELKASVFTNENVRELDGKIISFYQQAKDVKGNDIRIVNTHRIVNVVFDDDGNFLYFETKGDYIGNTIDPNPVYKENVIGIFRFRITGLGKLGFFLQKPLGILCFIGIPLVAFIIYDVLRRFREAQREANKNKDLLLEIERLKQKVKESDSNNVSGS